MPGEGELVQRTPDARAASPPTPASTSSNTSVGGASLSTSRVASMTLASSPPDATFSSGRAASPGLAANSQPTSSPLPGPTVTSRRPREAPGRRDEMRRRRRARAPPPPPGIPETLLGSGELGYGAGTLRLNSLRRSSLDSHRRAAGGTAARTPSRQRAALRIFAVAPEPAPASLNGCQALRIGFKTLCPPAGRPPRR